MAEMLYIFTNGFFMGLALIAAIGPQSCFVLRQGLNGDHGVPVALLCSTCDIALISVSVTMMASLAETLPHVEPALRLCGALFVAGYGLRNLQAAWADRPPEMCTAHTRPVASLGPTMATCVALTFLNPHMAVDMILLGSIAASHADPALFGLGAAAASVTFFFALVACARVLRPVFADPRAVRRLDGAIGCLMLAIAAGLMA